MGREGYEAVLLHSERREVLRCSETMMSGQQNRQVKAKYSKVTADVSTLRLLS